MRNNRVNGFRRITKVRAKRLYEAGEVVYCIPHKLAPGGYWAPEIAVTKTDPARLDGNTQYFVTNTQDFDRLVERCTFYNCNNRTGRYLAFYIKEKTA